MQGRIDRPDYRTALNVCLNGFPTETGTWVRRPGSRFALATRAGAAGRAIAFDFEDSAPYQQLHTDGFLRFLSGVAPVTTNDDQAVVAISTANPAVVQTSAASGWSTGNAVFFKNLGTTCPLLQNRMFILTVVDGTHFSLADAITNVAINGATLGALGAGVTVARLLEFSTPWTAGTWASLRSVPTDIPLPAGTTPGAVLLNPSVQPYVLQVVAAPTDASFATFSLTPQAFKDGPYFDPVPGGTLVTPSAVQGVITLTLSFNAYNASHAYATGDYVTSSGINYRSLVDANVGNTPASSPSDWVAVTGTDAFNPAGFNNGDIGRHVRLLSAPQLWAAGTAFTTGDTAAYNPTGKAGDETYWQYAGVTGQTGHVPGTDLTNWTPLPNALQWTWGKITALSNIISGSLAGSVNIGNMSGLADAFDGILQKPFTSSAGGEFDGGAFGFGNSVTFDYYVGKNYTGAGAQKIEKVTIYPSTDTGFIFFQATDVNGGFVPNPARDTATTFLLELRAKSTAPTGPTDGTLLSTTAVPSGNLLVPITLISTDQNTAWNYVWVHIQVSATFVTPGAIPFSAYTFIAVISQTTFFNPIGTGTSAGVNIELVGPPLLNTQPIRTWRLGLFSNDTGWPSCGTWDGGRLWLSGLIANRVDASRSDEPFNFAPTNSDGLVPDNAAISETFNAPDSNPIYWMIPDQQGIICGSKAGEYLVFAPGGGAFSPTNIDSRRLTKIGGANIEPRRTEHTIAFVQKFGRKVMEYFADVFSGKFTAPHLTFTCKHLTSAGIDEIAYQQELTPTVWMRIKGALVSIIYKRDTLMTSSGPTIAAGGRHTLGSGRTVESISVGPSHGGDLDALTMVTNDPATATRHIEVLTDILEEGSPYQEAWYLDDAVQPTSVVSSNTPIAGAPYGGLTLNGLWHLNGKTVSVHAGGLDCGTYAVANGSAFVPYGDGVSAGTGAGLFTAGFAATAQAAGQIIVGFAYNSDGQPVRPIAPQETGARNGPALGKIRRVHKYAVLVENSAGMSIGTSAAKLKPVLFKNFAGQAMPVNATFTGIYRGEVEDDNSLDGMIYWRVTGPYPGNVAALESFLHTQDQ